MKKVSILGTGEVGQSLALGFVKHSYSITFGTRNPEKEVAWKDESLKSMEVISFASAVKDADLVVLAVKGTAAEEVVKSISEEISEKIVIDVTNPIADAPPTDGVIKFFTNLDESLMERLQQLAPKAFFVKAFNSVGNHLMVNPDFGNEKPTMFLCGNSEEAKKEVEKVITLFGFDSEDMGKATGARAIEPLCMLWCIPGFLRNDWAHAFRMLKK